MAIVLALASALVFGGADFAGGIAARRNGKTFPIVYLSQLAGLVTVLIFAPMLTSTNVRPTDFAWGGAAGLIGCIGLLFFYRALAVGVMSIVSPVTAVVAAVIPVIVGLVQGESPSGVALLGIALGIVALSLFGGGNDKSMTKIDIARSLGPAVIAGVGFGTFFSLIAQSHNGAGLWPLVAARLASGALLTAVAITRRSWSELRLPSNAWPTLILAGSGDITANALFLLASRKGDLAIVGVIASLYPASTLVLARYVLHERLHALHRVAIGLAGAAVILIASA